MPTPTPPPAGDITRLLRSWTSGQPEALDRLFPLVYDELRRLAEQYLRRERAGHTLPPTALVHEAYLRLSRADPEQGRTETRRHFFAVAAQAMRRILVEHARRHAAQRRPSPGARVPWTDDLHPLEALAEDPLLEILAVHEGLEGLRESSPRKAEVVELRFFGGLSEAEVAEVLGVSRASVARDWRSARLLLARLLERDPPDAAGELS